MSSIGTKVSLLGSNAQEAAIVDQWAHFAEYEIGEPAHAIASLIYGFCNSVTFSREVRTQITPNGDQFCLKYTLQILDKNTEHLVRALNYLESYLATRPSGYMALDTLTLADFVVASGIFVAASVSLGSAERAQYPHIFAHYAKVTEDERVKQHWGMEAFVDARITGPITVSWS